MQAEKPIDWATQGASSAVDQSNGGATVNRRLTVVSIIIALLLAVLTLGCGARSAQSGQSGDLAPAGSLSASDILAKALATNSSVKSAKATFEANVTFDTDPAKLSDQTKAYVSQPIKISGDLASSTDPVQMELNVSGSLAGQSLDLGLKYVGSSSWIKYAGQWYQTPPEMQKSMSDSVDSIGQFDGNKMLSDAGIDPNTWMTQLTLAGDEQVAGVDAYHLTARPDVAKMLTDVFALLQNGEFQKLVGGMTSGATSGAASGSTPALPSTSADSKKQIQGQVQSMLRDSKVELWVAKDDFAVVKVAVSATIAPPKGTDSQGISSIAFDFSLQLSDINTPLTIQPPALSKTWADFQKALTDHPGVLGSLFSMGASTGATQ
jgi:hypothetical protein